MKSQQGQGLAITVGGLRDVEMHGPHARGLGSADVLHLIIDEDAGICGQAQPIGHGGIGTGVGFQDAGVRGIHDQFEIDQEGQFRPEAGAIEQVQFVLQDSQPPPRRLGPRQGDMKLGPDHRQRIISPGT